MNVSIDKVIMRFSYMGFLSLFLSGTISVEMHVMSFGMMVIMFWKSTKFYFCFLIMATTDLQANINGCFYDFQLQLCYLTWSLDLDWTSACSSKIEHHWKEKIAVFYYLLEIYPTRHLNLLICAWNNTELHYKTTSHISSLIFYLERSTHDLF